MKEPYHIVLDLTDCNTLDELHQRIKETFSFPDYYGENWDAFLDCMRFDTPVDYIIIKGEHTMPQELAEDLEMLHECLQDCKEERKSLGFLLYYEIID